MFHIVFVLSQEIFGIFRFAYTTELISQLPVNGLYSRLWTLKICMGSTNFISCGLFLTVKYLELYSIEWYGV